MKAPPSYGRSHEDYVYDIRADDTVLKVVNITLDCDLAMPAIVRHEPADMDGKAINHLIPRPIFDLPVTRIQLNKLLSQEGIRSAWQPSICLHLMA